MKIELFRERTRIILTILAIAWGTFAIASMLAIGEGLRLRFAETVANSGTNLLTVNGDRTSRSYLGSHANQIVNLVKQDLDAVQKLPDVVMAKPFYSFSKRLHLATKTLDIPVLAVTADYAKMHAMTVLENGRFISLLDLKNYNSVIVLGSKTVQEFFPHNPNPIGQYIAIGNKPFLIIGVQESKPQMVAHESPDDFNNWIPLTTYEILANPEFIDGIDITYRDPANLEKLKQEIQQVIAINHTVDPNDENIIDFSEFAQQQRDINTFFLGMQIFLGIVGALTLIIAGVGIANVMYASIHRATREIGIRMAIGARGYQIIWYYMKEALIATLFGGIIGLLMSALLVYGLKQIPLHGDLIEHIGQPKPVLSFLVIGLVVAVLGVVGGVAGFFPALRAARIDPARALTYE